MAETQTTGKVKLHIRPYNTTYIPVFECSREEYDKLLEFIDNYVPTEASTSTPFGGIVSIPHCTYYIETTRGTDVAIPITKHTVVEVL